MGAVVDPEDPAVRSLQRHRPGHGRPFGLGQRRQGQLLGARAGVLVDTGRRSVGAGDTAAARSPAGLPPGAGTPASRGSVDSTTTSASEPRRTTTAPRTHGHLRRCRLPEAGTAGSVTAADGRASGPEFRPAGLEALGRRATRSAAAAPPACAPPCAREWRRPGCRARGPDRDGGDHQRRHGRAGHHVDPAGEEVPQQPRPDARPAPRPFCRVSQARIEKVPQAIAPVGVAIPPPARPGTAALDPAQARLG